MDERKITRCKFNCQGVTKNAVYGKPGKFTYFAKFQTVYSDSPENKAFFEATPSGTIEIGTYKEDVFTPGKEYYVDFVEA